MDKADIEQLIRRDARLSLLNANHTVLLQALSSTDISFRQLAETIRRYPSIVGRLIFLANSPWSAPRFPVENLEMACTRLGFAVIKSVSISLAVASSFNTKRCIGFHNERFWCSALLVGEGAALLASCKSKTALPDTKTVYTVGLLHNIGLLWLADNLPEETSMALEEAGMDDSVFVHDAIRKAVGIDYAEVGGMLARAWNLPVVLVDAIEQHHNSTYTGRSALYASLVGYSAQMGSSIFRGLDEWSGALDVTSLGIKLSDIDEIYCTLKGRYQRIQEMVHTIAWDQVSKETLNK